MTTYVTKLNLGDTAYGIEGNLDFRVRTLTVGQIRVEETHIDYLFTHEKAYVECYMCFETGVGGGTVWEYGKNIFATKKGAEEGVIRAEQKASKQRAIRDKQQAESAEQSRLHDLALLQKLKEKYEKEVA